MTKKKAPTLSREARQLTPIRIPMPLRYLINAVLVFALWFVLNSMIGAGTITCNYNGVEKFRTEIGDKAFIGSGTQLVAPVKVGTKATIGAGTTLTRNAPEGKLTLGRARQTTIEGWMPPVP